ncbi:MAG: winged helix-turn-helix transcriptional regulator [Candidatus Aenigmarchaeota archaeon]|nr:winged helix-turn-helix transcriptional regulator [Candidatus Aenigmarchaeota archaeon]
MPRKLPLDLECLYRSGVVRIGGLNLLQILQEKGPLRFSEMYENTYRTPATLAHRLREAEQYGLVKKNVTAEVGKETKIYYEITEYGKEVKHLIVNLVNTIQEARKLIQLEM